MTTSSTSNTDVDDFKLYLFKPSLAAAIVFTVLFAVVSARHFQLLFKTRTWSFIPFSIGCLVETVGYGARAYSATQTPDWELMPYILQNVLILLGPTFFAASIYMVLGRLICFLEGQHLSMIKVNRLTKIFLLGDILSFFGQGGGGGLIASASDKKSQDLGNNIILVGLAIQVIFFGGFMVIAAIFHIRILRQPTKKSQITGAPWQAFMAVLYFASALIMVRSVFRMIEYAQGHNGALISKEIYAYMLDALLMIIVATILTVRHPSSIFTHQGLSGLFGHDSDNVDNMPMVAPRPYVVLP
ncbi:RTA1 like protein-domain-containing protein [Fusarium flagelliforme]|uniref:Protein rta1 n=1 Tax=Fusarium flagelliforme TaxID=2675880 RepID=A0A395M8D5_9HYPO|nr:RTA1 like protein-domain-containing protein [Fusarium flagelliforme]KAH7186143.1 RTA1 like protein-domain-containing protein [Fusarium flagelliforme]RFN43319.1 protein rta1 [Fusarium flagelliforme]